MVRRLCWQTLFDKLFCCNCLHRTCHLDLLWKCDLAHCHMHAHSLSGVLSGFLQATPLDRAIILTADHCWSILYYVHYLIEYVIFASSAKHTATLRQQHTSYRVMPFGGSVTDTMANWSPFASLEDSTPDQLECALSSCLNVFIQSFSLVTGCVLHV